MNKLLLSTVITVSLLSTITFVSKAEEQENGKPKREGNLEQRQERAEIQEQNRLEKKEEIIQKKCEKVAELITKRVEAYGENKDKHLENYGKVTAKLTEVSAKLAAKGFDVAELNTAIETWKTKVAAFEKAYADYIAYLESLKTTTCTDPQAKYKESLATAREKMKEVQRLRQEARSYYAHEIREAIKNLRVQAEPKTETEKEETND